MSQTKRTWKMLQTKNRKDSSELSLSKSTSKRYDPKKSFRVENDSMILGQRFAGGNIKTENSSSASGQEIRVRAVSESENVQQSISGKNILGKKNLLKQRDTFPKEQICFEKMNEKKELSSNRRFSKKFVINEIEKIQNQFRKFRLEILKQLERQESLIKQLIEKSFKKYAEERLFLYEEKQSSEVEKSQVKKIFTFSTKNEGKDESYNQSQIQIPSLNLPETMKKACYTERILPTTAKEQNIQKFSRFFDAMKFLRKNVEDISDLSEIDSINSSKNLQKIEGKNLFSKEQKLSYS